MNQNDYVILFDENGSPYIAHAGFMERARGAVNAAANRVQQVANQAKGVGRGIRQNHKYILKVNENGKTRYFYKQEEVKAYYEAKKRGIKNAAEYAQNAVKNKASEVTDKARETASKAVESAKDATGVTARNKVKETSQELNDAKAARQRADDRWWTAAKEAMAHPSDKTEARERQADRVWSEKNRKVNEAEDNARNARIAYSKTPLAKAEKQIKGVTDTANNAVTNAKNRFERMKSEFRDKADKAGDAAKATTQSAVDRLKDVSGINARKNVQTMQKALDDAKTAENRAENRWWTNAKEAMAHPSDKTEARERQSMEDMSNKTHERYLAEDAARDARIAYRKTPLAKAEDALNNVKNTVKDIAGYDEREHRNNAQKWVDEARESGNTPTTMDNTRAAQAQKAYNKTPLGMIENARNAISSAKDTAEKARTAVKDKAEDLSAKAKSTAQAAKESAQGMIENARSSTAKAVNEAWEKIPKNADGTVNPFDSNFQSAYNDWKSKKEKYDGSLTGQAKAAAEKATDSVKDMIDQAKKTVKDASQQISDNLDDKQLQKNLERDMKNHGYSLEDAYNQHKDWLKTMQSGQLPEDHKEYYKKMSELEDQAYKELKAKNSTKSSYTKKPDPVNSSGARPYETMKRDAREAGVDFAAYDKAASDAEKLAKRLMKEYREANETSGPKSLVGKMWYDDPEYKRAVEKRKTEEEKLVKQLYQ